MEMFSYLKIDKQTANIVSAQRRPRSGTVLASSDTFILMAQVNKSKLYRFLVPL